jgi:hypothetical protein
VIAAIRRSSAALLLVPLAIMMGIPAPSAAVADTSAAVTTPGTWSLAKLGFSDLQLTGVQPTAGVTVVLPEGAAQGPAKWWQVYLHVRVNFLPTATGVSYLTENLNGATSASVEFDFDHGPPGGMAWNTVDVNGQSNHVSRSRAIEFDFANFAQSSGITPGPVAMSFSLEPVSGSASSVLGDVRIDAAKTGLIWGTDSPDDLTIAVQAPPSPPQVGEPMIVHYTVTNSDASSRPDLKLSVQTADHGVRVTGQNPAPIGEVENTTKGTVELIAGTVGRHQVLLSVLTDGHRARASEVIDFTVVPRAHSSVSVPVLAGLASVAGVGLLLAYGLPRRIRIRPNSERTR